MGKILILTDGKAGHENQSRAFARALGCEPELLPVRFKSPFYKALSYVLDLFGVRTLKVFTDINSYNPTILQSHDYRAVIGTGSGTFYAAKVLAQRLGVPCGVVLYPRGYRLVGFDCILAPAFDRPDNVPNVIPIPANLVAADAAFYEAGVKSFRERHTPSGAPAVAVIVGGPNKCSTLSPDWMRAQLDQIFAKYKPAIPQSNNPTIKQSNNPTIKQSHNQTITSSGSPPPAGRRQRWRPWSILSRLTTS